MELVGITVRIECVEDKNTHTDLQDDGCYEKDTKGSMCSVTNIGWVARKFVHRAQDTGEPSDGRKEAHHLNWTVPAEDMLEMGEEADQEGSKREDEQECGRHDDS